MKGEGKAGHTWAGGMAARGGGISMTGGEGGSKLLLLLLFLLKQALYQPATLPPHTRQG